MQSIKWHTQEGADGVFCRRLALLKVEQAFDISSPGMDSQRFCYWRSFPVQICWQTYDLEDLEVLIVLSGDEAI